MRWMKSPKRLKSTAAHLALCSQQQGTIHTHNARSFVLTKSFPFFSYTMDKPILDGFNLQLRVSKTLTSGHTVLGLIINLTIADRLSCGHWLRIVFLTASAAASAKRYSTFSAPVSERLCRSSETRNWPNVGERFLREGCLPSRAVTFASFG